MDQVQFPHGEGIFFAATTRRSLSKGAFYL